MKIIPKLILYLTTIALFSACNGLGEGGKIKFEMVNTDMKMKMKMKSMVGSVGHNTATQLQSLQVFFRWADICSDITINGSGYDMTGKRFYLYSFKGTEPNYDSFDDIAARSWSEGYIDLANTNSMSQFSGEIQMDESSIGEYKYFTLNWFRPIKYRAEITLLNGKTLYTKDGVKIVSNVNTRYFTGNKLLTNSPAETAIYEFDNGGTWFKFLKPLRITAEDVRNNTNINVMLAFNPDGYLIGTENGYGQSYDSAGYSIRLPFFIAVPIAYRDGETVMRETYQADVISSAASYRIRVELYTLKQDEATLYGAIVTGLTLSNDTVPQEFAKVYQSSKNTDNSINLLAWNGDVIVSNFTRLTTVGSKTVALVGNGSGGTYSASFKLTENTNIN